MRLRASIRIAASHKGKLVGRIDASRNRRCRTGNRLNDNIFRPALTGTELGDWR